ncbi:MAG TPA: SMP-30/gluconolactonase/LRE family protein [Candidatus Dormibacteraeota bacterium]
MLVMVRDGRVLRRDDDGSLVAVADVSNLSTHPWNEIVVGPRGNAYVNNIGFEFPGGEFAPGIIALVTRDGASRRVADGIAFPNGMAVTRDGSTLLVAESYGECLTAFDIAPNSDLTNRPDVGGGQRRSPGRDLRRRGECGVVCGAALAEGEPLT